MLKLFRKTRRLLLTQGRLGKYLAYAVGEIFLVVIGILLALQIDAWNQAYQDRSTEVAFDIDPFDRRLMLAHLRKEELYRICNLELTLAHTVKLYVNQNKQDAVALIRSIEAETK